MARAADQFRQSDVLRWGVVAGAAAVLALVCANVSALLPDGSFAALHNSRAVNEQTAKLNAEIAALDGSKANLLNLAAAQQQLQTAADRLTGRLDGIEKASLSDRVRIGALEAALPRLVDTLPITGTDSSLITGSTGTPTPGFKPPPSEPPSLPALPAPVAAMPPPLSSPVISAPPAEQSTTAAVTAAVDPAPVPVAAQGPQWSAVTSLPVFTAPAAPAPDIASIAPEPSPAIADAPFPMTLRPASGRPSAAVPVALAPAAPPPAHPDVKAIGIAVGSPIQPAAALADWQQVAERVGVMLVGMSPLLADDPAGSSGKVLVAGPIASIAAATKLCGEIDRAGLSCTPMPYVGAELAPATTQ